MCRAAQIGLSGRYIHASAAHQERDKSLHVRQSAVGIYNCNDVSAIRVVVKFYDENVLSGDRRRL